MFLLIWTVFWCVSLLALRSLRKRETPVAVAVHDEYAPIASVFAWGGVGLFAAYAAMAIWLKDAGTRIYWAVWIEDTAVSVENAVSDVMPPIWVLVVVYLALLVLSFASIVAQVQREKGAERVPVWLRSAFYGVAHFRRWSNAAQLLLLLLASVTMLGTMGGAMRDVALPQLKQAETGIAALFDQADEIALIEAIDAHFKLPADNEAQPPGVQPPPRAPFPVVSRTVQALDLALRELREPLTGSGPVEEARKSVRTLRDSVKPSLAAARTYMDRPITTLDVEERRASLPLKVFGPSNLGHLSLAKIRQASDELANVRRSLPADIPARESATEALYRATIDATAEAIITGAGAKILDALLVEMSLARPLIEAGLGVVRSLGIERSWSQLRKPLDAAIAQGPPLKDWIAEQRLRYRAQMPDPPGAVDRQRDALNDVVSRGAEAVARAEPLAAEAAKARQASIRAEIASLRALASRRLSGIWLQRLDEVNLWSRKRLPSLPSDYRDRLAEYASTLSAGGLLMSNGPKSNEVQEILRRLERLPTAPPRLTFRQIEQRLVADFVEEMLQDIARINDPRRRKKVIEDGTAALVNRAPNGRLLRDFAEAVGRAGQVAAPVAGYLGSKTFERYAPGGRTVTNRAGTGRSSYRPAPRTIAR